MKATVQATAAIALLLASAVPVFAQGQVTQTNTSRPPPTPITQSSLPNSDKYKVEARKPPVENAMRSMQAGNGTSRSRQ